MRIFWRRHQGLDHVVVKIIDKTVVSGLLEREGFWAYILNSFVPYALNLRETLLDYNL